MTTDDRTEYNLAAIRDQLLALHTAESFRQVFLYTQNAQLRAVQHELAPGDGLGAMVEKAITF